MKTRFCFIFIVAALAGCSGNSSVHFSEEKTKEVLDHHWVAFKENDLEAVMADYTEESILITPDATYQGLEAIRENFVRAFKAFPKDQQPLQLNKTVVVKDVGYILWQAKTTSMELSFATDTFLIHDGKIVRQTYGGVAKTL